MPVSFWAPAGELGWGGPAAGSTGAGGQVGAGLGFWGLFGLFWSIGRFTTLEFNQLSLVLSIKNLTSLSLSGVFNSDIIRKVTPINLGEK